MKHHMILIPPINLKLNSDVSRELEKALKECRPPPGQRVNDIKTFTLEKNNHFLLQHIIYMDTLKI